MIRIGLELREDLASSTVSAEGFELVQPTPQVADKFGLPWEIRGRGSHDEIWACMQNWIGRVPNEWWMNDGRTHQDRSVMVERKAVGARLVEVSGKPNALASDWVENFTKREQESEVSLAESVGTSTARSSEHGWNTSITASYQLEVSAEVEGIGGTATYGVAFTAGAHGTYGKAETKDRSITVARAARLTAGPRMKYPVSLLVGSGTCKVLVDFEYRLMGNAIVFYEKATNWGNHFVAPIEEFLRWMRLPNTAADSEILDIGFVTGGTIRFGKGQPIA